METPVIAMIFEFWMTPSKDVFDGYATTSAELRDLLADFDGFNSVERFESCNEPGKFVAVGFFDDEADVARWRNDPVHRRAQELGRNRFFTDYRLRMADVTRDYGPTDRTSAPTDSTKHHEGSDHVRP